MAEPKSMVQYLIRWSGIVFVTLIVSMTCRCIVTDFLVPKREDTCPAQVASVVKKCMEYQGDEIPCVINGTNMLKACPEDGPKAQ